MAEKIGFIKLERKIIDWEWYTDINVKCLFIHMLLLANHSGKNWRGQEIERGTFVTSIGSLSLQTGLSKQSVRTSINKLKKTGEITIKTTNKNTLIIVTNYDVYQSYDDDANKQINNQSTNEQQTTNKQLTTTKNVKNVKNDKNVKNIKDNRGKVKHFVPPSLEEVRGYCHSRNNNVDAEHFMDHYISNGWLVGKNKMKDWKATVRTWERRNFSNTKSADAIQPNYSNESDVESKDIILNELENLFEKGKES